MPLDSTQYILDDPPYPHFILFVVVCDVGHYRNISHTTHCTKCPHNYYQNMKGKTSCIFCGAGKVTMQDGSSALEDCVREYRYDLITSS